MRIEPGGRKLVPGNVWWDEEMGVLPGGRSSGRRSQKAGCPLSLVDMEWGQGGMKGWDHH